ncbi:MAG TPA: hypothetical protein VKA25_14160, partial [Gemmatimonadales bacterium]|nr:hypothetical protein [Gemmatimonadales bacterium]
DEVAAAHAGVDMATPGDLVVVLVDRVTLVWEALAQRTGQDVHQQVAAGNGSISTSDIPPSQLPLHPNGVAVPAARESQASRKHRATA